MSDAELSQVAHETKYLQEPDNHRNHNHDVQDAFDLTLHWDSVHKP